MTGRPHNDEDARRVAAMDQRTGDAREMARVAAAFFLEVVRAGVPQGEAVALTDAYIRAELGQRLMRDTFRERTERDPLDQ